ncbi:MAG: C39 family peptidase [Paludibacteraceae bacterium]|nr:C39 family peptidase [Paludibacteraceae bacterium]
MIEYNVSKRKSNYSQRNNKVNPNKSCNTTSMTMAASYQPAIWKAFKESEIYSKYAYKFSQPEDCLQQYMLDNGLTPTYHPDLSRAFNQFLGYNVTSFSMNVPLEDLIEEIKSGRPVVISGDFPKSDGRTLGHIVVLVGLIFEKELDKLPSYWIIDDPYGDTLNDWTGSGNDIKLPHEFFMKVIKNKGMSKKWAHTFKNLPGVK